MRYYPIYVDIQNRPCLVVGGGGVGTRKVKSLLGCGARVTVVTTAATEALLAMAAEQTVQLHLRGYDAADLAGMFLVVGATDDEALNRRISRDAEASGLLCNIVDRPQISNFIVPAVVNRGDLTIAVSTAGTSPAFAKHLRRQLEVQFGPVYADFLHLMRLIRERLLADAHAPEAHKPLFEALIDGGLLDRVQRKDTAAIDALLGRVLGPDFRYADLMQHQQPER